MQCSCGFDFAKARLNELQGGRRVVESFVAVSDADYRKFLKLEIRVLAAKNQSEKLKRVAKSAQFAGSIMICPKCSALLFNSPETDEAVRYREISREK